MRLRHLVTKVIVAILIVAAVGVLVWWRAPGYWDRVRFPGVDADCSGVISLSGAVEGRHCLGGPTLTQTASGYRLHFEYASDGWVILGGPGNPYAEDVNVGLALVRTPGPSGRWMCATGGTLAMKDLGQATASLRGVTLLVDEDGLGGNGTLTKEEPPTRPFVVDIDGSEWGGLLDAASSNESYDRLQYAFSNDRTSQWLFLRTEAALLDNTEQESVAHGFLLQEDARATGRMGLSVVTGSSTVSSSQIEAVGGGVQLDLNGLSSFVPCGESQSPSDLAIDLEWGL